jgi:hypothetical protein
MTYKSDLKNKASFHDYVDGQKNLLCIARTAKGMCVAGFYLGTYGEK